VDALARLQAGTGTHPRHVGIVVRITKQSVAREARVSPATLYRFPDLVHEVSDACIKRQQRPRRAAQVRAGLVNRITELEAKMSLAQAENLRLTRLLAKYDPSLGEEKPINLDTRRKRKKGD